MAATDNLISKYKECCLELFNIPFRKYKKWKHQDKKIKQVSAQSYPDYDIFCDMKLGLEIMADLIKYAVWRNKEKWGCLIDEYKITTEKELLETKLSLPKTPDNLVFIYQKYKWTLDDLNPEVYKIISLENYELMGRLNNINQLFYFNTFPEMDDVQPVLDCENDTIEMWVLLDILLRKLMKHHIEIARLPN